MNLGESLNLVATGLNSSAYSSILGNSFSQDILGLQTANSFGIKSDVFIDGIRLLEKIVIDATTKEVTYEPTMASKILEGAQKVFSLGGFGMFAGKLERNANDEKNKFWVGSEMSIGDIAELNFMGDRLTVNRGINDLEYNRPIEKLQTGGTDFDTKQHELETFFWVLWGAALITSLVFMGYSVAIAVDQSLADNTEWQIANSAMQIAQVIALTLLGIYERNFLSNEANAERDAAYLASDAVTLQAFQTELDSLELRMQTQINDLANKLNIWQATSTKKFDELTAAIQKQAQEIADNKDKIEKQLQAEIEKLKENLEKQLAELEKSSATKEDVEKFKKEIKARLDALEKDLKDSKKSIEENQKSLDDIKRKFAKSTAELTTKVAELDVFTRTEISRIEDVVGNVIQELLQVKEDVTGLQKESGELEFHETGTLPGNLLRWLQNRKVRKGIMVKTVYKN